MSLLDNQNSEFKTQLHENSVIDLTQNPCKLWSYAPFRQNGTVNSRFNHMNFYPGNPECQVLESNRESQDSNHERQKVKSTENEKKKI